MQKITLAKSFKTIGLSKVVVCSLTAGIDTVAGTAAADTINAGLNDNSTQTLQGLDVIDGGAGSDTLNVVFNTAGTYAPTLTSVEVINLTSTAIITVDLVGASAAASIKSVGSTAAVTVNNIASSSASLTIQSTAVDHTLDFANSAVSGSADAATVTLSGMTAGTLLVDTAVETVSIVSAGSANTLTGLTSGANILNISGDQAITITAANTTSETINAGTATGAVTITSNNVNNTTITTGSGGDAVTLTGGAAVVETVSTGAGNDTVTFTANLADADILDGGAGTDTIVGTSVNINALTTTTTTSNITNFEAVSVSDEFDAGAGFDISNVQEDGITTLNLRNATAGGTNVTNGAEQITGEAGTFTINLGRSFAGNTSDLVGNLTLVDSGTATTDAVVLNNLSINSTTGNAVDVFDTVDVTSTGYETVTINTGARGAANTQQDVGTITITPDTISAGVALTVTGANSIDIATSLTSTSNGAMTINASGMTAQAAGTTTFDVAAVSMGVGGTISATGSSGDDNFGAAGGALGNFASTINGGAGDDAIFTGTSVDNVNGGAGDDTINVASGAGDTVDGGDGDDRIIISADGNLTATDTYAGGAGTDTLAFTAAVTDDAATFSRFSGFEVFEVAPAGADTFTMSNFINNQGFTRVNFGDAANNTITLNNVNDAVTTVRVLSGAAGDTLAFDRLIDGSANSLTVDLRGGAITTLLTANDEETITITGNSAADDTVITTLTAGDLVNLVITGAADVTTTNNITSTVLANVNASAATGAIDIDAGSSLAAITATGGSGTFTFEGGSGNDVITGGSNNDILLGGNGTDTIVGGLGDDSIEGQLGADTLTGGIGTDTFNYVATTVSTHGGDTITDFTIAQSDQIEIVIAVAIAGNVAAAVEEVVAIAAAGFANGEVQVRTGAVAIDVSGNNAADIASIIAGFGVIAGDLANDAEGIVIFNADTDGDGNADQIQAWWVHDTAAGGNGTISEAAQIAYFSNLSATVDLGTLDFTTANFDFA